MSPTIILRSSLLIVVLLLCSFLVGSGCRNVKVKAIQYPIRWGHCPEMVRRAGANSNDEKKAAVKEQLHSKRAHGEVDFYFKDGKDGPRQCVKLKANDDKEVPCINDNTALCQNPDPINNPDSIHVAQNTYFDSVEDRIAFKRELGMKP